MLVWWLVTTWLNKMGAKLIRYIGLFNFIPALLVGCAIDTFWIWDGVRPHTLIYSGSFAVLFFYTVHRLVKLYSGAYRDHKEQQQEHYSLRSVYWLISIVSLAFSLSIGYEILVKHWSALLIAGCLASAYALPIIPGKDNWRSLRELPAAKGIIVAGAWAYATTVLPLIVVHQTGHLESAQFCGFIFTRFLLFYIITGVTDIRDVATDPAHIKTIPQRFGIVAAANFYMCLLLVIVVFNTVSWFTMLIPDHKYYGFLASNLALGVLIHKSKNRQPSWFYSILVDGVLIFQWLCCQFFLCAEGVI